jgi:hypothetical protein
MLSINLQNVLQILSVITKVNRLIKFHPKKSYDARRSMLENEINFFC